jgi:hypothetical protein
MRNIHRHLTRARFGCFDRLNSPRFSCQRIQPITSTGTNNGTATVTTIHTDFLGSPVAETNSAGTVTRVERYTPYGEPADLQLDAGPGFTGHATDVATGLTYCSSAITMPSLGASSARIRSGRKRISSTTSIGITMRRIIRLGIRIRMGVRWVRKKEMLVVRLKVEEIHALVPMGKLEVMLELIQIMLQLNLMMPQQKLQEL